MITITNTSSSSLYGSEFAGLLTIFFITLKLTDYIDWPWQWVLSPIWIMAVIISAIIFGFYGFIKWHH